MAAIIPAVIIEPLRKDDLAECATIERAGQPAPWSMDDLRAELENGQAFHFGIRSPESGKLSAFILCRLILDELHIHNLCTLPALRRRGYGRALLLHALAAARRRNGTTAFLEVAATNDGAIALYRSAGFSVDFIRKGYYASGDDALVMSSALC
jgi:[ribosomal protein S18]-alanine N-acetyltransferase